MTDQMQSAREREEVKKPVIFNLGENGTILIKYNGSGAESNYRIGPNGLLV